MNREDIIRMAREANILEPVDLLESNQWRQDTIRELERFASLVAAAEREACAQVCDTLPMYGPNEETADWYGLALVDCAAAIRARGAA